MLMPKRIKYRKQQRKRMTGITKGGEFLAFGDYGLVVLEPFWMTARQIEACRITISRCIKRAGKVWIRVFPDKPVTKKPLETRMGKGKGAVDHWVAVVRPGRILFELTGIQRDIAYKALHLASYKIPVKTRILERDEGI